MSAQNLQLTPQLRKILAALRFQARHPINALAKQCALPAHSLHAHIKRLNEHNVITPYVVVDVTALGYSDYGVYVVREHFSASQRSRILNFLERSPLVPWIVEYAAGEYQYAFSIVARRVREVDEFLLEFGKRTGQTYLRQSVVQRVHWYIFGQRPLFGGNNYSGGYECGISEKCTEIDALDERLLRLLSMPMVATLQELSRGLGVPHTTVDYRLKSLERRGVILCYAYMIDAAKLGYQQYHLLISERRRSPELRAHLLRFLRNHERVVAISVNVGEWACETEVLVSDPREMIDFEGELYEKFPEGSLSLRALQVLKVYKLQPLPARLAVRQSE